MLPVIKFCFFDLAPLRNPLGVPANVDLNM